MTDAKVNLWVTNGVTAHRRHDEYPDKALCGLDLGLSLTLISYNGTNASKVCGTCKRRLK